VKTSQSCAGYRFSSTPICLLKGSPARNISSEIRPWWRGTIRAAGVGKEVGINFAFDDITVQPNTVDAHRLMAYGAKHGREDEIAESLFQGYFLEGAVLTDQATLVNIGERAGLERAALEAFLASNEDRDTVLGGDVEARRAGIGGVPFFIFNRRIAVSGAHEPETLLGAMLESLKTPA
jgi:predicted DsbA family dithiol-disulfide isomerase